MMLSRQPITFFNLQVPLLIKSSAFPNHTSVPCDKPEICNNSEKVVGFVSSSIPLTNFVPNSGTPSVPVFDWICSGVTPKISGLEKRDITPGSSGGIVNGSTPDRSCSILIMVGSS